MEQISLEFTPLRQVFTVSQLNAAIHRLLDREFQDIFVAGEISGVRLASSGHYYFTLKEKDAQLRCVCFRSAARYLKFKPQDGIAALARGRVDVYETRGEYQLVVESLEPQGHGALQFAFEQLKKKLAEEGLFSPSRKRPLPRFPGRIGIVTSPKGAVIRDMLHVLERRFPGLHIRLYPALVQGEGSVEEVCRGIEYFSQTLWAEVVIVARGGGSLEDLWTFNEERVARAIAGSAVPVISAVGHETDVTIADFVADLRAPTPSAAAELVICTKQEVLDQIDRDVQQIRQLLRYRIASAARRLHERGTDRASALLGRKIGRSLQRVDDFDYRLREWGRRCVEERRRNLRDIEARLGRLDLRLRFAETRRRMDLAEGAVAQVTQLRLARARGRLEATVAKLHQLSPLRVLERGYAIVENQAGRVVKDAAAAPVESQIRVLLARGRLKATVNESET
jgi:exodeoxyribonuclease VII large subunit